MPAMSQAETAQPAAAPPKSGIGARLLRKEDARHLRGRGCFVADVAVPGTLEIAFARSPYAHARLLGIDVPPDCAGRVFTARDLPALKPVRSVPNVANFKASGYPVLATDKVRFAGEILAACVAPTRAEAEDLADAVEGRFEELPAVVDAVAAIGAGAPRVHDHWTDNLYVESRFEAGDIAAAEKVATVVVRREYRMNRQVGVPMETRGVLAHLDPRTDELVVYDSTQGPHVVRVGLAEALQRDEQRIRVIAPDVGGGFGIKNRLYPEEVIVAALALELDQPVRWIEDRREHLLASIHARDHFYRIAAFADAAGRLLGLDAEIVVDGGAYALWPNSPLMETGMALRNLPGPYQIAHYRARGYTVATNKAPMGPYRGVARPGACFAIERTIDEVARAVGRDPMVVRMENMVQPAQMPYRTIANLQLDNGDYPASVRLAAGLVDVAAVRRRQRAGEPDGRLIGIGFASYTEQTAHGCGEWVSRGTPIVPGYESATARLMTDGSLVLLVGIQSHGQGLETTLAQVAHHELGISPDRVGVRHGDSALCPFGMGTFASRSMVMAGGAVARATRTLGEKIKHIGAHLLQTTQDQVRLADDQVIGPVGSVSLAEIARTAHLRMDRLPHGTDPILDVTETYQPAIDSGVFAYATNVAVVAVDPATGQVGLLDFGVAEDCGTIVNPMIVDGQIAGGITQGIGTALFEEMPYDASGQPLATTFADYLLPGSVEIPEIKIAHLHTPAIHTEYGMKGMGEGGAIAPPAAIANAVRDALAVIGAELNETPITPRRVLAAIRAAQGTA
jgi:carbon-monoxide dehydrogenase large subunit